MPNSAARRAALSRDGSVTATTRAWSAGRFQRSISNIDNNSANFISGNGGRQEIRTMADGLRKGLTSYGAVGFSLFLRKAFIKAMGYSDDARNRPIGGSTNTHSDDKPWHGNVPQSIEAGKRGGRRAGARPM